MHTQVLTWAQAGGVMQSAWCIIQWPQVGGFSQCCYHNVCAQTLLQLLTWPRDEKGVAPKDIGHCTFYESDKLGKCIRLLELEVLRVTVNTSQEVNRWISSMWSVTFNAKLFFHVESISGDRIIKLKCIAFMHSMSIINPWNTHCVHIKVPHNLRSISWIKMLGLCLH